MRTKYLVPAAQWRRGVAATERIGVLLKRWEDRGREYRDAGQSAPVPAPARQSRSRSAGGE